MLSLAYLTNTYSMGSCNLSSRWNADIALNQHIFKMHKMGASSSSVDHSLPLSLSMGDLAMATMEAFQLSQLKQHEGIFMWFDMDSSR